MKKLFPGIALAIVIAFAAKMVSGFVPALEGVSAAILLGMVVGNLMASRPSFQRFETGIGFSEKRILSWAIILMGFKLQLYELSHMGVKLVVIVLATMAVCISAGVLLGRLFGFSRRFSVLIGVGNGVCGSSAIAAVAPTVEAKQEEIGVSVGIINLLGAIGMLVLPVLVRLFHFSDMQSAYTIGGVLQAIGQVVAAGFSVNETVGEAATLIKMLRVLMIGPIVLILSFVMKGSAKGGAKRKVVPTYIIGFAICSVLGSIFHSDMYVLPHLRTAAKLFLMVAMAGVGMRIRVADLLRFGHKSLLFGIATHMVQLAFMLAMVLLFV